VVAPQGLLGSDHRVENRRTVCTFSLSLFLQRIYSQAASSGLLMSTQVAGLPLGA